MLQADGTVAATDKYGPRSAAVAHTGAAVAHTGAAVVHAGVAVHTGAAVRSDCPQQRVCKCGGSYRRGTGISEVLYDWAGPCTSCASGMADRCGCDRLCLCCSRQVRL